MVLETIGAAGVIFKAKYVKRTGTSGNYKYWYRNPKTGKLQAGKQPAKKPSGSQGDRELTYHDLSPTAKEGFNIFGAMSSKEMIATGKKYEKETGKQFGRNDQKESFNKWVAENYSDSPAGKITKERNKLEETYFKKDRELLQKFRKERDAEFDAIRKIKEKHREKRDKLQKEQDSLFSKYESDSKKLRKK